MIQTLHIDIHDWLYEIYGYDVRSLLVDMTFSGDLRYSSSSSSSSPSSPTPWWRNSPPGSIATTSAYECSFDQRMAFTNRLSLLPTSKLSNEVLSSRVTFRVGHASLVKGVTISVDRGGGHAVVYADYEFMNANVLEAIRDCFNETYRVLPPTDDKDRWSRVIEFEGRKPLPEDVDIEALTSAGVKVIVVAATDRSGGSISLTGERDSYTITYAHQTLSIT